MKGVKKLVNIRYLPVRDSVGTKIIAFKHGDESLASDPFPVTGSGEKPEYERTPYLNLDDFLGTTGSGEHPCSHDKVDGTFTIHFGSSIMDGMEEAGHSPQWTDKTYWFPRSTERKCAGCVLLSTIDGVPSEEWVGLALRNFGWHNCKSGTISDKVIDVTIRDGLWAYGDRYEYRTAKHYYLTATDRQVEKGYITYSGYLEKGSFPRDITPDGFASCLCSFDTKEDLELTCYLVDTGSADEDLAYALNLMAIEGFKDAIAGQYVKGTLLLEHLSCTDVAMDAIADVHVLDSNNIENATQASDLTAMIPPLEPVFNVLRDADDPTTWAKSASEIFLWYKYVAKPTCSDVKSHIDAARTTSLRALQQLKGGSYRSSKTERFGEWDTRVSAKVTLHPYAADAVQKAINVLDNVGLLPTLARGWDLVPYSFVADWVTNVGSCLGAIDTTLFQSQYQIDSVTTGRKATRKGYLQGTHHLGANLKIDCSGIDFSLYRRHVGSTIPVDPRINLRGLTTTGHTLAGAALLVGNLG
jgi:hypothetical protein